MIEQLQSDFLFWIFIYFLIVEFAYQKHSSYQKN